MRRRRDAGFEIPGRGDAQRTSRDDTKGKRMYAPEVLKGARCGEGR